MSVPMVMIDCDFCGDRHRLWGGVIYVPLPAFGNRLRFCRTCTPVADRYAQSATLETAERLRLAYRAAVILRRWLLVPHERRA